MAGLLSLCAPSAPTSGPKPSDSPPRKRLIFSCYSARQIVLTLSRMIRQPTPIIRVRVGNFLQT